MTNSKTRSHLLRILALALAAGVPAILHAMGSPPLITDDPATPGDGHWEINIGVSTEHRSGEKMSEAPLLDLNYGIGETVQLKYEVPYLVRREDGESRLSGLGNSELGVKWRFHDGGEKGLSASVYPQLEFNNPGSSAADRGLVEHGTAFLLPVQVEKAFGTLTLNLQLGREFRSAGDSWFYGLALSRPVHNKIELGVELAGGASTRLDRSRLTVNLGLAYEMSERSSIMASIGRELHNHEEPRARLIAYVGWQIRR